MADVTIHGFPQSSYVWSTRIAASEKGITHDLAPIKPKSEAHLAMHPWGKMPILTAGEVTIFETSACMRYIDAAFEGPSLMPESAVDQAIAEQWTSAFNCYMYGDIVKDYVLAYYFPKGEDGAPDRAGIDAAIVEITREIGYLDDALEGRNFLAGDRISTIDILLGPALFYLTQFPEGKALVEGAKNVGRLLGAVSDRPSFFENAPPK